MAVIWNTTKLEAQAGELSHLLNRMAQGDYTADLRASGGVLDSVTPAVTHLQSELRRQQSAHVAFGAAIDEMIAQHELGWIDFAMDPTKLAAPFDQFALKVNKLVKAHIDVKMRVVELVKAYAADDFSLDMDRLPGKKAMVTEAMDSAKQSFVESAKNKRDAQAYLAALREMQQQHTDGWIDEKIPVASFTGTYADAAQIVNDLVAAHIAVKMRVVEVVKAYANGDFSVDMDRLPGKKKQITDAIDSVKASFEGLAEEVVTLVDAANRGDFTVRGQAGRYENSFKVMVEGLNSLMNTSEVGLNEVVRVLGALAKGDLTEKITNDYQGTFGQLKDDSNLTVESLTTLVKQIKASVDQVNDAAREIALGNSDLSQRTEEQASSLEETASSMEELTSTVRQNADNAKQANQLAIGARDIAERGGQVVSNVVGTMSSINESAKKIVDIISVIDGIAFQTNILALNAAVEAARAGEQGRGFAVVAGEVRNLAQRSAAAAKEIKSLINDSVEKTDAGSRLVDQAGQTMNEIVVAVKRVTDIMSEIAAASSEQGAGIEQVNTAIAQMEQVTQQNAALVEEAAAAASSLEDQSQVLVGAVSVFRLDEGGSGFGRPATASAPEPRRAKAVHAPVSARSSEPAARAKRSAPKKTESGSKTDDAEWTSF